MKKRYRVGWSRIGEIKKYHGDWFEDLKRVEDAVKEGNRRFPELNHEVEAQNE